MKKRLKEWNKIRPKSHDAIKNLQEKLEKLQYQLEDEPQNEELNAEYFSNQKQLKQLLGKQAIEIKPVSYTHLTLPTTPYV